MARFWFVQLFFAMPLHTHRLSLARARNPLESWIKVRSFWLMKRPINSFANCSAFWKLGGSQVSGVLWMLLGWLHICCFLVFVLTRLFCVGLENSPIQGCLHYCRCGLGKHSQLASLRLESVYRSMLMLREAQKSQKDRSIYHSSKSHWGSWGNVMSWILDIVLYSLARPARSGGGRESMRS